MAIRLSLIPYWGGCCRLAARDNQILRSPLTAHALPAFLLPEVVGASRLGAFSQGRAKLETFRHRIKAGTGGADRNLFFHLFPRTMWQGKGGWPNQFSPLQMPPWNSFVGCQMSPSPLQALLNWDEKGVSNAPKVVDVATDQRFEGPLHQGASSS